MIIIDRPKLRFLLAGRTIQIDQAWHLHHKGRTSPPRRINQKGSPSAPRQS